MAGSKSCPDRARWQQLLDGALPDEEIQALNTHLESCVLCQHALDQLTGGQESWANVAQELIGAVERSGGSGRYVSIVTGCRHAATPSPASSAGTGGSSRRDSSSSMHRTLGSGGRRAVGPEGRGRGPPRTPRRPSAQQRPASPAHPVEPRDELLHVGAGGEEAGAGMDQEMEELGKEG